MTKKLLASVMAFALCQFMLATDMIVKQKNGEIKKFNVEDVEEVIFNENSNIPNDSTVVDASESPLNFSIKPDSTVEVTGVNKDSESIEIPSKVRIDGKVYTVNSIKYSAFSWKRSLTTLEIPSSITSIAESSVFSGSSKLKSINVASYNPNFSSVDGVLYNKDKTQLIHYPDANKATTYIVTKNKTVYASNFYSKKYLENSADNLLRILSFLFRVSTHTTYFLLVSIEWIAHSHIIR